MYGNNEKVLEVSHNDDYSNLEELKKTLVNLGYSRCEFIEGRGQFSVRGGIVDISINETLGVRIEFWGDEVDSIRNFNITSQRSINTLDKIKIYPAHEFVLDNSIDEICKKITKKLVEENLEETIKKDIEQIKSGNYISKIESQDIKGKEEYKKLKEKYKKLKVCTIAVTVVMIISFVINLI